jgi:succinate dehydrogenase/fumarate reductase flavoprotein subunit
LSTGPAVSKTLRGVVQRTPGITRIGDVLVTDLVKGGGGVTGDGEVTGGKEVTGAGEVTGGGAVTGAVGMHIETGEVLTIEAKATIIATGGLTRLYRRNSASANMAGDGYALALRAGAALIDMEFVQFFPIGHLAPRLIGMDPIMWDPFRYKLGGRLLNGLGEAFVDRYGSTDDGKYVITRDLATYAITKEVEAGRGSPHGGAWLSFRHIAPEALRAAFGPVIGRLLAAGIDLGRDDIEVAPIAHYHMGGIRVDTAMATGVPGLFAAGEAVGGANGANRLSGNAITEALAFGRAAGRSAAGFADRSGSPGGSGSLGGSGFAADEAAGLAGAEGPACDTAALFVRLQAVMADYVGPFRTAAGLATALDSVRALRAAIGTAPPGRPGPYDLVRVDWFDLRQALLVAECVIVAASARCESRGAHQREDFPSMDEAWRLNQVLRLTDGALTVSRQAVAA